METCRSQPGLGNHLQRRFLLRPDNPVVTTKSMDGKYYLAVYDALRQPPTDAGGGASHSGVCGSETGCNRIGIGFSADGVTWQHSSLVPVQTAKNHPCGQIRTPLGLAPEPERCKGCYSVLWTGIAPGFRPVCRANE
jgi:hypothetical protein